MKATFKCENNKEGLEKIDQESCNRIHFYEDVDELVDTAFSRITAACNAVFKVSRGSKHSIKKTAISWWTEELTVLRKRTNASRRWYQRTINPLTPNDRYSGRTAPLTSKRCILYIYSTNIGNEYFKHGIYSPFFPLQNAVCFIILTYLVPVLFTFYIQDVLKLKKKIPAPKG